MNQIPCVFNPTQSDDCMHLYLSFQDNKPRTLFRHHHRAIKPKKSVKQVLGASQSFRVRPPFPKFHHQYIYRVQSVLD